MTKAKPMPARTLKALKASIVKWRKNEEGDFQGVWSDSCPLCKLFHWPEAKKVTTLKTCERCPVLEKTGFPECYKSPWTEAKDAAEWHGRTSRQFKAAAKVQRKFLESLLPKGEKA